MKNSKFFIVAVLVAISMFILPGCENQLTEEVKLSSDKTIGDFKNGVDSLNGYAILKYHQKISLVKDQTLGNYLKFETKKDFNDLWQRFVELKYEEQLKWIKSFDNFDSYNENELNDIKNTHTSDEIFFNKKGYINIENKLYKISGDNLLIQDNEVWSIVNSKTSNESIKNAKASSSCKNSSKNVSYAGYNCGGMYGSHNEFFANGQIIFEDNWVSKDRVILTASASYWPCGWGYSQPHAAKYLGVQYSCSIVADGVVVTANQSQHIAYNNSSFQTVIAQGNTICIGFLTTKHFVKHNDSRTLVVELYNTLG